MPPRKWSFLMPKVVSLPPQSGRFEAKIGFENLKISFENLKTGFENSEKWGKNEDFQGDGEGEEALKSKNGRFPGIRNAVFNHFSWIFRRQTRQNFFLENLCNFKVCCDIFVTDCSSETWQHRGIIQAWICSSGLMGTVASPFVFWQQQGQFGTTFPDAVFVAVLFLLDDNRDNFEQLFMVVVLVVFVV